MITAIKEYAEAASRLYKTGVTTEHSFRRDLQMLLNALRPQYSAINEPQRSECGAPDYALVGRRDHEPYAYVEAKDLFGNDLCRPNVKGHKEPFDRYKSALSRIAFTDYLDFHFCIDGEPKVSVRLLTPDSRGGFVTPGNLGGSFHWTNCCCSVSGVGGHFTCASGHMENNDFRCPLDAAISPLTAQCGGAEFSSLAVAFRCLKWKLGVHFRGHFGNVYSLQ